ncbi:RsfA family transcriptional regulator [Bacillus sp. FJAT-50079]|uniref:RsfA family transcriptional regulator n=1 Tax=Bacillus sp. FJAT-50079 TaxID=2833577 RepID=UPI001BC8DBAA|nr:RsfA family transcriptional regulator [Bacillus sp. FJAT-50079]MBS4207731.1 RsfA family transcriptional regulator [Bacillus sp. FJAT-50079]
MTVIRQDAWTKDEDMILAETVLTHIRTGSTQLKAFEEAGTKLKRTAAACGFRWNAYVRKQYKKGIDFAKKERKQLQSVHTETSAEQTELEILNQAEAATFMEKLEKTFTAFEKLKMENQYLQREIMLLKSKKAEKINEIERIQHDFSKLQSEYYTLLDILNNARERTTKSEVLTGKQ